MRVAAARTAAALLRRSGRGGTSLPGKLLLRLDRRALSRLAAELPAGSALLSATNGKTTTAAMAARILEQSGVRLVHNSAGANMSGGIVASLIAERGELGLFEVDEFYLPAVAGELRPKVIGLGNLFRDQLDRYGELETIAGRWGELIAGSGARLVLNADDPLIAGLERQGGGEQTLFFGVEDPAMGQRELAHAADSKHCRICGLPLRYERIYLGHLGVYACPDGHQPRPSPHISAHEIELRGISGAAFTLRGPGGQEGRVEIPLPGLFNVYNALFAASLCSALDVPFTQVLAGLADAAPAFGRGERLTIQGSELHILLVKNPAGANEVLRTLVLERGEHAFLGALNDRAADGRDVSWIWDADFELLAPRIRRITCSGTRAAELALRLKYAGVPPERIAVRPDLEEALADALMQAQGRLFAIPTYTAMLDLRRILVRGGHAKSSWT